MDHWFGVVQDDDALTQFAHRTLGYALLVLFCISLLLTTLGNEGILDETNVLAMIFYTLCFVLLRRSGVHIAGNIFIIGFWSIVTVSIFLVNGLNNVVYFGYVLAIIFSNLLLLDRRLVLSVLLASLVSTLALSIGHPAGLLPFIETAPSLSDRTVIGVGIIAATGVLLFSTSRKLEENFTDLVAREAELAQRNRELEALADQLHMSEERYRLLFENMAVPSTVYDEQGTILLVNPATARVLGVTPEDLIGKNARDVLIDGEKVIKMNQQVFDSGDTKLFEGEITLRNGEPFVYMRHTIPLFKTGAGTVGQIIALTTDITRQKETEQRMRELELAAEKADFYGEFVGTVSHDIKTPLSVIGTSLYLLEKSKTDEQRQQKINQIKTQVKVIEQYIQDMLMISRLEHMPAFNKIEVALEPLVTSIVGDNQPKIDSKQQVCTMDVPQEIVVSADVDQLKRALTNLIENAINYTPEEGAVTIRAQVDEDNIQIDIQDSGMGIAEADLPHIFERFYRTSRAKDHLNSGTGLGLAIVKKIVDLHDGEITVESEPDSGTTFSLRLPY